MRVNPLQAAGQAYVDAEEQYLVVASRHLQAKTRCDVLELETMVFTEDGRGYETQCDEAREALRQAEAELRASTCRLNEATDALAQVHPGLATLYEMDEDQ